VWIAASRETRGGLHLSNSGQRRNWKSGYWQPLCREADISSTKLKPILRRSGSVRREHRRGIVSREKLKPVVQTMPTVPWEMTHSVETNASPAFAWHYWTNIANWDDPPAEFELEGSFATGSRGVTRLPRQDPLYWIIREVTPPDAATIEMSLDGAALSFEWRFVGLVDGGTRLIQRIVLKGEKADMYLSQVKAAFTANLTDGMNKLAKAMANAYSSREGTGR
jgi:hypothetical protein